MDLEKLIATCLTPEFQKDVEVGRLFNELM